MGLTMFAWSISALFLTAAVFFHPVSALSAETTETVCVQCHGGISGKLGEPVNLWRGSIHAENNIDCNACHGGDPKDMANAMSKERGFLGVPKENEIPAFCGRCHVGVLKDFQASSHGKALGKGGPTCVSCHGNHQIVKSSLELINEKSCTRCHSFERAKVIKAAMQETEDMIVAIDRRIVAYKKIGTDTDRLEKGLFSVRNQFHSLFHNVNTEMVKKEAGQIQIELKKLEETLAKMDKTQSHRKTAGVITVVIALLAALLFHLLGKTFKHDKEDKEEV